MTVLLDIILPVFGLILLGYIAGRTPIMPPSAIKGVANAATYIMIPALLFRSLAQKEVAQNFEAGIALAYFSGCVIVLVLALLAGRLLFRLKLDQLGVFGMAAMYSNAILMGLPLIETAFGPSGLAVQTRIIAFHSLVLIPVTTMLITLGRGRSSGFLGVVKPALVASLTNPIILGLLAGLAWGLTGLGIWEPLDRLGRMLTAAASPTALIALGATQAGFRIGGDIAAAIVATVLKLAMHPLLVWFLTARVFGLPPDEVAVATALAALPAGANVYLQAHQYDCWVEGSANAVTLSTLLSVVSLAVVLALVRAG